MSLVAYGDSESDDSDHSDEDTADDGSGKEPSLKAPEDTNLFAKLPPPKRNASAPLDPALQDMVVEQGSKSKRARIVIPSLNDFGDDEEEEKRTKKFQPSKSGSGLVGLLPAPKNVMLGTTQLKPHILTQNPTKINEKATAKCLSSASVVQSTTQKGNAWSDEEDEAEENPSAFFSFDEPKIQRIDPAPVEPMLFEADSLGGHVETNAENSDISTYPEQNFAAVELDTPARNSSRRGKIVFSEHDEPGTVPHDVVLDDGALVRLRGRRNEEINIIDVNAADQMDHSRLLVKGLTEQPIQSPNPGSDFHTSQLHRRKHQITYLAQQAKEREQELKNMWAQNRLTRRQTQAKYGF